MTMHACPLEMIRLRQHNGELAGGARATSPPWLQPWRAAAVVTGFRAGAAVDGGKRAALQFEWAWKHPTAKAAAEGGARLAAIRAAYTAAAACEPEGVLLSLGAYEASAAAVTATAWPADAPPASPPRQEAPYAASEA